MAVDYFEWQGCVFWKEAMLLSFSNVLMCHFEMHKGHLGPLSKKWSQYLLNPCLQIFTTKQIVENLENLLLNHGDESKTNENME